jgi:putative transposon-encoded protein
MVQRKEPDPGHLRSSINVYNKAKFEVYGEEMIEKEVKQSGNSGRVYLPPEWVGKHVKIIRIE